MNDPNGSVGRNGDEFEHPAMTVRADHEEALPPAYSYSTKRVALRQA